MPTTYVLDTFTESAGTILTDRNGETNADWQRDLTLGWPNLNKINSSQRVHRTLACPSPGPGTPYTNGSDAILSLYTIPVVDYVVEADFYNAGNYPEWTDIYSIPNTTYYPNCIARIAGRYKFIFDHDGYFLSYNQLSGIWSIERRDSFGTNPIEIGKNVLYAPIGVTATVNAKLVLRGRYIELWLDNILSIRLLDSSDRYIGSARTAFLQFESTDDAAFGMFATYDESVFSTYGIHIDNFKVHDDLPPFDIPQTLLLDGDADSYGQVHLWWSPFSGRKGSIE